MTQQNVGGLQEAIQKALEKLQATKPYQFRILLAKDEEYYWAAYADNTKLVAWSGETYTREEDAERAKNNFLANIKKFY